MDVIDEQKKNLVEGYLKILIGNQQFKLNIEQVII